MSNSPIEISLLTELSDEQQEIIAGGQFGDSLRVLSGLSRLKIFDPLSVFGDSEEPSTQSDSGDCQRTEEEEGNTSVVRITCLKTERYP